MRQARLAGSLLVLALSGCGEMPGGNRPGETVLVVSNRGGAWRIFEVQTSDGSARLIGAPESSDPSRQDATPCRLPDGRIAFVSVRGGRGTIYLADGSGREGTPLFRGPSGPGEETSDSAPAPLGRDRIVFARARPGAPGAARDLYVARLDGSPPRRLTRSPADDSAPAASPDARAIAFVSDRSGAPRIDLLPDVDAADPEAEVVDLSGQAPAERGAAPDRPFADGAPAFLPDGSIVFSRRPEGGVPHLFQMEGVSGPRTPEAGRLLRQITDGIILPYGADEPVVPGDGTVLFVTGGPPAPSGARRSPSRYAVDRIVLGGFNLSKITREKAGYDDVTRRLPPQP